MIPSPRRPVSPETQRLYKADWASFEDWCGGRALTTLPADPATVAAFLTEAAPVRWAAAPRRPPPAKPSALIRMATPLPARCRRPARPCLLLLAAGGLGRAALVGLDVEHIRFTAAGAELSTRRAGVDRATEPASEGTEPATERTPIIVPRGTRLAVCPVQALRDWLDGSNTRFGPVFRKIDRWGLVEHHRLGTDAIRRILDRRAPRRSRRTRKAAAA